MNQKINTQLLLEGLGESQPLSENKPPQKTMENLEEGQKRKAWNWARINKICEKCGKAFRVSPRSAKQRFCSRNCFYSVRFKVFNNFIPCEFCGKLHKSILWKLKNHKHHFCSFKCRCEFNKTSVKMKCDFCGISFEKKKSQKSRSDKHFCCFLCSSNFHTGKNHTNFKDVGYGIRWKQIAQKIRDRDKVCRRCGKGEFENKTKLHVHHIIPFRYYGVKRRNEAHREENLICLCKRCHKKTEYESTRLSARIS